MLRSGISGTSWTRCAVTGSFRARGAKVKVTKPLRDGELLQLRDRVSRSSTARATAPPTRSSGTPTAAS